MARRPASSRPKYDREPVTINKLAAVVAAVSIFASLLLGGVVVLILYLLHLPPFNEPSAPPGWACLPSNATACPVLHDLYLSTNGSGWGDTSGWAAAVAGTPTSLCTFAGVTCGETEGVPVALVQFHNNMAGTLPSSLGSLTGLTVLQVHSNELSGTLPDSLGGLTSLRVAMFGFNRLSGTLPASLAGLTALTTLYVDNNMLTGEMPVAFDNASWLRDVCIAGSGLTCWRPSTAHCITYPVTNGLSC
jgi:hypothetical protein